MSKIISFSVDEEFAAGLNDLMRVSGYKNRSRFLRDAAAVFADLQRRGDLATMEDDRVVEGHMVVYYQHTAESKLLEIRHSDHIEINAYNHSCLTHSHTCVDIIHAKGTAAGFRTTVETLQGTPDVDKVTFVVAPLRQDGCC